jgi:hypothetical protein
MLLTACDPLLALLLVQPPVAVHELAFVEFQVNVAVPPEAIVEGVAVSVTTGFGTTVTVALALPLPPAPVQVSAYVVVAAIAATVWLPLVAVLAVQPPVAAHEVALVADHDSTEVPFAAMLAGLAVSVTLGRVPMLTTAVAVAVPPAPVQAIA